MATRKSVEARALADIQRTEAVMRSGASDSTIALRFVESATLKMILLEEGIDKGQSRKVLVAYLNKTIRSHERATEMAKRVGIDGPDAARLAALRSRLGA